MAMTTPARPPEQGHLEPRHIAFLDLDHLFFELERFKAERGWHNLNLSRAGIRDLLADATWYRVLIPESGLRLDSFGKVRLWQEIALALLKKYTERYYTFRKREWELPHLEYRDLAGDDPNFPMVREEPGEYGYRILVEKSRQDVVARLEELKAAIEGGALKPWTFQGLGAVWFDRHPYQPLLALEGGVVEVSPAPLNRGERRFIEDLKAYCDGHPAAFEGRELYLLRNMSRGRGIGFFEAGNFHPRLHPCGCLPAIGSTSPSSIRKASVTSAWMIRRSASSRPSRRSSGASATRRSRWIPSSSPARPPT